MGRKVAFFGMLLIEHGASTEVLRFRTCPIYVHTYFIRHPAAEYATPKPYGNLTRLSPRVRVWPARLVGDTVKLYSPVVSKGRVASVPSPPLPQVLPPMHCISQFAIASVFHICNISITACYNSKCKKKYTQSPVFKTAL